MAEPINLTPDQAGTPATARNADPSKGTRRPRPDVQAPRNVREAGRELADKLREARANTETPATRRETSQDDLPQSRRQPTPEVEEQVQDTPSEGPSEETAQETE